MDIMCYALHVLRVTFVTGTKKARYIIIADLKRHGTFRI